MKKLIAIISLLVAFSFSAPTTTTASQPQAENAVIYEPMECETMVIYCFNGHAAGYAVCCGAIDYFTWMHLLC